MTAVHKTKWLGVWDAKISKLTADPSGGTPTYATSVDIPGIKSVGFGGDVNNVQLRGDNGLIDSSSVIVAITLQFENALLSLDALAILMGGAVTDSGSTPAQKASYGLINTDTPNYFKFEAQTKGVDTIGTAAVVGDGHLIAHKCIISGLPDVGFAEEDYRTFSASAIALPTVSQGKWVNIDFNETAVAIT